MLRRSKLVLCVAVSLALGATAARATTFTCNTSQEFTNVLGGLTTPQLQLGDTILLTAGNTFTGQFTLRNITTGSGWITIQSSALASLPGPDVRVSPSNAGNMPKIAAPGGNAPAIRTAASAHHYKLIGLEIYKGGTETELVNLVAVGDGTVAQDLFSEVPQNFVFDRCYIHGMPSQNLRRAIALNSGNTDILNCYISDVTDANAQSAGIGGANGPGPFRIINNYIAATGENIIFGGDNGRIPGYNPADMKILRNHLHKPIEWRGVWGRVCNNFEIKRGQRILVEGNIAENNWVAEQTGIPILLKLADYAGTPWALTEDITFRNNIVRGAAGGITLQGRDYSNNSPAGLVRRLNIVNNIWDDINSNWGAGSVGKFLYITHGPTDVTFDHNTAIHSSTVIEVDSNLATYPATNFRYRNNIHPHNAYGVRSTSGTGNITFNTYFTDAGHQFIANILMGGNANLYTSRPGNYFPASWTAVGFTDMVNKNYRLLASSPYNNVGTDGKDLGVDQDQVEIHTRNVKTGNPLIGADDVLIYASKTSARVGNWAVTADTGAAGGNYIGQPNAGVPKITTPAAAPANYFEINFTAKAGVAYHIWVRGRAINNDWNNDSGYIQFDKSVTSTGTAQWRIGTTTAAPIFLEEGSGAGLAGWGWNDNAYNIGEVPPMVYFSTSGAQKLRIQAREDGYQIDQIMLSPVKYISARPGLLKNDINHLPEQQQ
jgi:hypothetical protein